MRHALIGLLMLAAGAATPSMAQLSLHYSSPGVHIGVNLPVYPVLQRVPGYPVYYAPAVHANYFFYDGLYWVFEGGNWYASSWYNGPWYLVDPYDVPAYVLRVPVRYYRVQPAYFHAWYVDAAPRWGEYWGSTWATRRAGWDRWNRSSVPAAAPLPTYQRSYSGRNYPSQVTQQAVIQQRSYNYRPRDNVARTYYQQRAQASRSAPAATIQPQAPARQERVQQAQQQRERREFREERVQHQRQERVQQAQQRQERVQQAQQRQEREQRFQQAQQQRQEREQRVQQAQQQRVQQAQQHPPRNEQHAMARERQQERAERGQGQGRGHGRGRDDDRRGG